MLRSMRLWAALFISVAALTACGSETIEVTRVVTQEKTVEVDATREVEVEVEVTRLVEVEVSNDIEVTRVVEQPVDTVRSIDLQFGVHQALGMAGQDVFVKKGDELFRQTPDEIDGLLSETVYRSGFEIEADEFAVSDNPFGPFSAEGAKPLAMTFADWQTATGSGTYKVQGDMGTVDFSFENLVPNAVYTLWCARGKLPPDPVIVNLPCGELDGSQNVFESDGDGNLHIAMSLPARRNSSETHLSVFAIAYHSDDQSWGPVPGPFGSVTHTQLLAPLPGPDDEAWQVSTQPHVAGDPARGRDIFETGGGILSTQCIHCHTLDGTLSTAKYGGPSLMDISTVAADRVPELSTVEYLRQSILDPSAYVVEDFGDSMEKSYQYLFSEEDINSLVAFLLTQ